MNITVLTPDKVERIKESLKVIIGKLDYLATDFWDHIPRREDMMMAQSHIKCELEKIENMLIELYYVFRCNRCAKQYAVTQSNLILMVKQRQ